MPTPARSEMRYVTPPGNDLDFGEAMRDVVRGLRLTRREWASSDYVFLQGGILHIRIAEDDLSKNLVAGTHKFIVSEGDLTATDWIVSVGEK